MPDLDFDPDNGAGAIPLHELYGGLWQVIRLPAGSTTIDDSEET